MRVRTSQKRQQYLTRCPEGWARREREREREERRQIDPLCARSKSACVTPRIPTISLSGSPLGSIFLSLWETAREKKPTSARGCLLEQSADVRSEVEKKNKKTKKKKKREGKGEKTAISRKERMFLVIPFLLSSPHSALITRDTDARRKSADPQESSLAAITMCTRLENYDARRRLVLRFNYRGPKREYAENVPGRDTARDFRKCRHSKAANGRSRGGIKIFLFN